MPKTRTKWWLNKFSANKDNDARAAKALKKDEWKIIIIWECKRKPAKAEKKLTALLTKQSS